MGSPRIRLVLFALLSIMGITLIVVPAGPAVSEDAPAEAAADEATIELLAFQARPDRVEIKTGTTVTWVNKELIDYPLMSGSHEIKADDGSFQSPAIAPGTRWSRRFNQPGEFTFRCADHPDLVGTIVVTGPAIVEKLEEEVTITEPKPDDPTTWVFQPPDVIVTTGMSVVWRNNGANVHTVTADDKRFDSGDVAPGGTFKFKFDEPGAFVYHCTPHPWMTASIRVVLPGAEAPPPPPPTVLEPSPTVPRSVRATAPAGDDRGPVRHEVDIIEPNPANPNSWAFDPRTLDLRTGDTVVWRNTGRMEHSVTAADGSFDSGLFGAGGTWSHTFTSSAFVEYRCTPHPWMRGVLRIANLSGAPPAPPVGARTSAGSATAAAPPVAARQGSGPVTLNVNIVEPDIADAMSWTFNPKVVDAKAGDTVVWRNTGAIEHTVTGDGFDSGLLGASKTFSRTFDTPGLYAYSCTPHPWMKGIVRVTGAEGGPGPALPSDLEAAGSGGSHHVGSADSASSSPLHLLATSADDTRGLVRLGWALLLAAVAVGFTMLLSWAWSAPAGRLPL